MEKFVDYLETIGILEARENRLQVAGCLNKDDVFKTIA